MKIQGMGILGVALASVLAAGTAYADGSRYAPSAPAAPIWNGLYVGADVGFAYANADVSAGVGPWQANVSYSSDNTLVGGVLAGYNIQRGATVFGVEADVNFVDASGVDTLASVRGRYGLVMDGWLVYGTAGLGIISGDFDTRTGWVAGGGVETKLRPNMTVGFEALYYDFGSESASGPGWHVEVDESVVSFRGRLTYQLNRDVAGLK